MSFFVGGRVRSGNWEWILSESEQIEEVGGEEALVDEAMDKCSDHFVGECLGLAWDEQRGCQFSLSDMDCRTRNRFICEADPVEGEAEDPRGIEKVHSPLQVPDEHTIQMPY